MADAGSAAFRVSGLELGGLFGSLLAGRISDALIARDPKGGNCGKRVQVCPLSSCAAARMTSQAGPSRNDPFAIVARHGWPCPTRTASDTRVGPISERPLACRCISTRLPS